VVRSSQFNGKSEVQADEQANVGVSRPLHIRHGRHSPRLSTIELHKVRYAQQPTEDTWHVRHDAQTNSEKDRDTKTDTETERHVKTDKTWQIIISCRLLMQKV